MIERLAVIVLLIAAFLIDIMPEDKIQKKIQEAVPSPMNKVAGVIVRQVKAVNTNDLNCMVKNIYFEARNQGPDGMWAVANVVRNRMGNGLSACEVIYAPNQFSWYKPGVKRIMGDKEVLKQIKEIALEALLIPDKARIDNTDGAVYYHAKYVRPSWSKHLVVTTVIGDHIFYKEKE